MLRECTRFCSNSAPTLIDHIWITNVRKLVQTRIINTVSDHELISATVKTKGFVKTQQSTNSRVLKNFCPKNFKLDLLSQTWSKIYQFEDVKLITNEITKLFIEVLDSHAPKILRHKCHKTHKSKLSTECLELIKKRNNLKKGQKSQIILKLGICGEF